MLNWFVHCIEGKFTFLRLFKGIQRNTTLLDCYLSLTRAGWESEEECVTVTCRSSASHSEGPSLVLADVPWYSLFILISSGSWQLYEWWVKISFFNKCQSKKCAWVAFPVQTQCWKGSKICLEGVSIFWWGFQINAFSTHSHQDSGLKFFVSGAMSLHFHPDTYVIIWLIYVLPTHLGIFLLPLDIGPEMCIFIYPHDPQAFENVGMKFSKYHHSSTILMLLMLRLDGAVVRVRSLLGRFCLPTASEWWPGGFHGEKKSALKPFILFNFRKTNTKMRPQKTFSDRELTGLCDTLHYPSPVQPTPPAVSDRDNQWQWV